MWSEGWVEALVVFVGGWILLIVEGWVEALVVFVGGGILFIVRLRAGKERFPPGPLAWPIIGHAYLVSNLPHKALRDMSKIYGDMVGLRLGQQKAVVVSSPELAKEVLLTHDKVFANRPPFHYNSNVFYKNDIIFSYEGPHWRTQRKFCMVELFSAKRLRELEYVRQEEQGLLLQQIHKDALGGTRAVDLGKCVGSMSSRLVMRLLHSKATAELAGENLHKLISAVEHHTFPTLGDIIPWLSCFDFLSVRPMRRVQARMDRVLSTILDERKQSAASHYDDLLQALLSKEVDVNTTSSQQEKFTLHEIKAILMDMIAAGIHTTSVTLEWGMAELLRKPNCIPRLQKEIDTMVGKKKQITDADIAKLSYLKCVVKEVFRLHPVVPLLVPRILIEECKVRGYVLPKNTLMLVNVWAIGRDNKVWANANEFMPERFEGNELDVKGQHFELLPFGSGRRICLGMALGLSVVEVTIANLVNSYDWELPDGQTFTSINMDEKSGFTAGKASPLMAIPKPRE